MSASSPLPTRGRWIRRGREIVLLPGNPPPGGSELEGEVAVTATQAGVIDNRIDVHAQHALLRMAKGDPSARADAAGMLGAVKSGALAGIYKEDQQVPALRARSQGMGWWQVIPSGQDAAVFLAPAAPPLIVFRDRVRSDAARLDPALRRAWRSLQLCGAPASGARARTPGGWQAEMGGRGAAVLGNVVPIRLCKLTVPRRILIFFGYSGAASDGTVERDRSNHMVALTLKEHLERRFPGDRTDVICAWHKNTFVRALLNPSSAGTLRQIHYVGHGAGGGLYFGYKNKVAATARATLATTLTSPSSPTAALPARDRRILALKGDAGLMTGFFTDALAPASLAAIKAQMASDTLMHVWGCFAGAPTHTYDTNDAYWNLFNAAGSPVNGIARDIARSLGIRVTAVRDPRNISGMNYWYRDTSGAFNPKRPVRMPQWLWPAARSVLWVTYDAAGTADETNIRFLDSIQTQATIKPGQPPAWFTGEIPVARAKDAAPALPACSAVAVTI